MEKEAFSCCKADNGSSCSINDTRAKVQVRMKERLLL